ncbi:hypothetical protein [Diaphorobacter sp.]|uniref:hypothetical protein n=1 Tax=Diaphorobacter sp. TaxID=1934310 RepID=UPI0025912B29|nr:hypothetical protein [Diaphorobacter sp.]
MTFLRLRWNPFVLAIAALLSLVACAPAQPDLVRVGRAELQLPAGTWQSLGGNAEQFDVRPDDTAHDLPMQTRAVALRGRAKEPLAVLVVQTNASNHPRDTTLWTAACLPQKGVQVEDAARGSPVRIDCLRYKRSAGTDGYLASARPALAQWLTQQQAVPANPYSHVSYRYSTPEGGYVSVDVLADRRLLRPTVRNNEEFLRAGRPAQEWMEQLAQAARQSITMLDGRFVVPPFPQALPE